MDNLEGIVPSDQFSPLNIAYDEQMVDNSGDDKLMLKFYTSPVMHPAKSTEAGRPIFEEVDHVIIRIPGNQLSVIDAPVTEYLPRFKMQYNKWKTDRKDEISGTPIELFPELFNKVGQVAELKALNIQTVEQLANLSDNWKTQIMGGMELSRRAQAWLEETTGTDATVAKLEEDNAAMRQQLAAMQSQLDLVMSPSATPTKATK